MMKKVLVSLLVLVMIGSVALAAKAPVAKVKAAESGMKMGVGVDVVGGGTPYLRLKLSDSQAVDVGLGFNSTGAIGGAAASSTITLLGRYESVMLAISNSVNAYWGGQLQFQTISAGSQTFITLTGYLGSELMINPNVGLYANIGLLTFQICSVAGTSQTNFTILNGSGTAYSGLRVYL